MSKVSVRRDHLAKVTKAAQPHISTDDQESYEALMALLGSLNGGDGPGGDGERGSDEG